MRRPGMSKTRRIGGDGYFGEIPALKEPEDPRGNIPSGIAETQTLGYSDDDYVPAWWPDMVTKLHEEVEVEVELARLRDLRAVPFEEWPLADLKRLCSVLRGQD